MKESFFVKLMFKDYIAHYRKLTPDQAAADVAESMEALETCNPKGTSFGAKLVRMAMDRANSAAAIASRNNGNAGGRPLKLPTWDEFLRYINVHGIDYTDAREWWEMTMVDRAGKDRDGKTIKNWIGALTNFIRAKEAKRESA